MSRVNAIISASGYLHHRLPAVAVNHYRDNAITYKAQRDKKCQRTEAGERGTTTCRCQQKVMLLRSMQNTMPELGLMLKLK